MTHCVDFFQKWKREPNFCGISKTEINAIEKYLDFVKDFSKENGIDENVIYRNVPISAVKPILKFKKDSDLRKKATKQIAQTLKDKHAVTGKYVNSVIGLVPEPKKFKQAPITISSEGAKESFAANSIKDKIRLLTNVLTPGQMNILIDVMKKQDLDDEYAALSLVIKWAGEKIKK